MPPPQQLPSDHADPRPRFHPPSRHRESSVPVSVSVPATKRPPPPPAPSAAKKMARPSSAPDLTGSSVLPAAAASAARPRPRPCPPTTPAKNGGAGPHANSRGTGTPASPSSFMAPRGAATVRPARRLTPGTPVYVRTTFRPRNVNIRCRILLWLRARVVSSPDAYHCKVKYAADLSDVFAGKIVSKPADQVRVAPPAKLKPARPEAAPELPPRR